MSGQVPGTTRQREGRVARSRAVAALALVLVAAACGSSSSHATPEVGTSSTAAPATKSNAAPTSTVPAVTVPGGSIRLVSETGVTPAELKRADTLLAQTIVDIKHFETPAMAYAAGYRSIGDGITGDEHYVNWSYSNDGHILDPMRPESVVYEVRNGKQVAVAAMYQMPYGDSFADVPDVGGALTQWHVHENLCLTDDPTQKTLAGFVAINGQCQPGTSKAGAMPMLHVWVVPNPCGPFAALEGIGAGQVPKGETRQCSTKYASVP
jgi:hypothetical protein